MDNNVRQKKIIISKLFPYNGNKDIWNKLMIDYETISYISLPNDANIISKIISHACESIDIIPCKTIITDATAGAGGNVLSFANYFMNVNAIEFDTTRYTFLTNNIEAYNLNNVNHYCDNCLNLIHNIYQDILFFDPPWGGKDYKEKINLRLKIANIPIETIILNLFDITITKHVPKIIAIKLPKNYDLRFLYNNISHLNKQIMLHVMNKMILVVVS